MFTRIFLINSRERFLTSPQARRVCCHCSSWTSRSVRSAFISFFQDRHDHLYVPSSSVIPAKGQGSYFTNAGMNQFKPIFLGNAKPRSRLRSYKRVVNSQKCLRVGGKHNDLEDVGRDLTHHTFFEMLGNWSFGDYFKKEACGMALELLTDVYGISLDRLYFTYFAGDECLGLPVDEECRNIWLDLGVPSSRILPFGMKDNFWDMGETGPCGPCTEIHFDHLGNCDGRHLVNSGSPDVVEIWNLVFMQHNRKYGGELESLPQQHVDTGMGLERMTAVLQGTRSNYDTDLFQSLFQVIQELTSAPPYRGRTGAQDVEGIDQAYRRIADHTRMMTVAISDGLLPGRGTLQHKLKSVIHRALHELEFTLKVQMEKHTGILGDLSHQVVLSLGDAYPELQRQCFKVQKVLNIAEEQYRQSKLNTHTEPQQQEPKQPHDRGKLGTDGWYRKNLQTKTGSVTAHLSLLKLQDLRAADLPATNDQYKYTICQRIQDKYDFSQAHEIEGKIISILVGANLQGVATEGDICGVILDKTCFYSESGGQAADTGYISTKTGTMNVLDVQEHEGYVLHIGQVLTGQLSEGLDVSMKLDQERRVGCMSNHTATHLLNAAFRRVIGDTQQMGSDVQQNKFSFDFSSVGSVSRDQLADVESLVKRSIHRGHQVQVQEEELEEALTIQNLVKLDNVDYPSPVRVVRITEEVSDLNSVEFCGGTHVYNTADLKEFCVVKLSGGQGVKQVTCVTGDLAKQAVQMGDAINSEMDRLEEDVKSSRNIERWPHQVKDINTSLENSILPKLVRDNVRQRIEILGQTVKTSQNTFLQQSLQKVVEDLVDGCSKDVAVQQLNFNSKQMQKALSKTELRKPVALVSQGENVSLALIAAPVAQSDVVQTLTSLCKYNLREDDLKEEASSCGEDKTAIVLKLRGKNTATHLSTVIHNIVEEGFS